MYKNTFIRQSIYFLLLFFSLTLLLAQSHLEYESAENLYRSKSFDECQEQLDEILRNHSSYHDSTIAATYKLIGDLYLKKYELARTIEQYEMADTLYLSLGERHASKRLNVVNKIGICYAQQDNLIMTAKYFKAAYDIASSIFEPLDLNMAKAINNLAAVYLYIGDFDQSLQYFEKSASIKEKFAKDNPVPLANTYENMASIYGQINQMGEAESYLNKAGQLYKMEHEDNEKALLGFYVNLVGFYIENDRIEDAIEQLSVAENLSAEYRTDKLNVLLVDKNFGVAYMKKQEYDKALQYFHKTEQQIIQYAVGQKDLAIIYTYMANIYAKQNLKSNALNILGKARASMSNLYERTHKNYLNLLQQQVLVYLELAELDQANLLIKEFDENLQKRNELSENDLMFSSLKMGAYTLHLNYSAKLFEANNEEATLDEGIETAEKTFAYQDDVLSSISDKESKLYFFKNAYANFSTSIFLYLEKYKNSGDRTFLEKAFQLSEKAKFYSLKEARGLRFPILEDNISKDLIEREKQSKIVLGQVMSKYENLLDQEPKPEMMIGLIRSIDSLKQERKILIDKIKGQSPKLSKYLDSYNTTNLEEASKYLGKTGKAYISYFLSGNELFNKNFAFICSSEGLSYKELFLEQKKLDAIIGELVRELKLDLNRSTNEEEYYAFEKPSMQLWKYLFKGLDLGAYKGLIFNLHKNLYSIPFEVLKPSSEGNYLIQDKTISYTSSLNAIMERVGAVYDKNLLTSCPSFVAGNSLNLSPLDNSKLEVDEVINLVGYNDNYKASNKQEFLQEVKDSKFNIIHLATHAAANQKGGYRSYLAFGGDSTQMLYSREIFGLPIEANLVVLSACQSGNGEIIESQGVLGLSTAFAATNSNSMLASLWNVNDASTSDLMISYYHYISQGESKDVALRRSKLDYLSSVSKSKQHPFYWASFIQIGDVEPLQFSSTSGNTTFLISLFAGLMLFLLAIYFLINIKKRAAPYQ